MSSDINTLFSFPGTGLDTDSDLVTIQAGDSKFRNNVIISDDGNFNVITNTLGNTRKPHTLPSGTNTVVGYVEDKENSAGIYFVNNSTGNHSIIRYNSASDAFDDIISTNMAYTDTSALGIPITQFVDAGIIGNGSDQFLIWTDGDFPKMINIAYAIAENYNAVLSGEEISFYKAPMLVGSGNAAITTEYIASTGPNTKLSRKIFQFTIRLRYFDKTFSTLSNHSEISFPRENIPSGRLSNYIDYGAISVLFNIQNEPSIVDSYQLLYRIVDVGEGVPGTWYIYDEYDYTSKGSKNDTFRNDKSIGVISDAEAARPYDYVPDKSNHVGIIDSNRAVFDVAQEGYDDVDLDVSVASREVAITGDDNEGVVYDTIAVINSGATPSTSISITVNSSLDYNIYVGIDSDDFSISSYGLDGVYIGAAIKSYFDSLSIAGLVIVDTSTAGSVDLSFTTSVASNTTVSNLVLRLCPYFRTLKTGASYKFGIEYGYGGKRGSVQTNDDLILPAEDVVPSSALFTNYALRADLTINHAAPSGATDFRIVSFGSNIDYVEEYMVRFNYIDISDQTSEYTIYLEEPYTVIKRDDMVNRMRAAYGDSDSGIDYGFDFQVGDVVRFVGNFSITPTYLSTEYDVQLQDVGEYVIEVVTDTEIKISSSAIRELDVLPTFGNWLIQIIRKKETFDAIAQEFSPSYPIASHVATHDITEYFADTWKSKQVYVNENNNDDYGITGAGLYAWMEKPKISLLYDSRPLIQGRYNAVGGIPDQDVVTSPEESSNIKIYWTGKFIDNSGVNFLNRVDFDSYKELDDRNGFITVINQVGDTLKVYQERKANSLYLKTTSADDPNGTSTFVFSDNVMSDPRQGVLDYGCTHFTSYVKNVRDGYFFDLVNGDVLQDSPGGVHSISEGKYRMHTYFKNKAKDILLYGEDDVQIHATFDDDLEMYVISFVVPADTAHEINDTVAFHEPSGRWFTHFNLPTNNPLEYYGRLSGKTAVSFVKYSTSGPQLWLHNSNAVRNNFWGEQFNSEIWIHANEAPMLNKSYDSIEINSKGFWSCPDEDSIEINKPSLMRSRIVSGKFKVQEGIYRSEFLRNALNGALAFVRNLLLNGQLLRGREMTIKLKNTDTTESQIETASVRSSISK